LDFVSLRDQYIIERQVNGYEFEAETKDGTSLPLFVYKYEGKWGVNVTEVNGEEINAVIVQPTLPTRREAIERAKALLGRVSDETIRRGIERIRDIKAECKRIKISEKETEVTK